MRCPVLVSRAEEADRLRDAVRLPATGHGAVVVLRGEPGVGKSRLAAVAAEDASGLGLQVLTGRGVRSAAPVALRPLAEALLGWLRTGSVPDDRALAPYLPALSRLAPQLGTATNDGASSVMLIGEGLLRLASALGGAGMLLLVEDLHWADPETLAVLEYVADNCRDVPLVLVATVRPHDSDVVAELVDGLASRGAAEVLDLAPLGDGDVDAMLSACLGGSVPPEVAQLVRRQSAGFPLLVEEVLADLRASGALVADDGGWTLGSTPTSAVPRSFARSVQARLAEVSAAAREVIEAAALLGESFDWQVVGDALALDERQTSAALRELTEQRLVVATDRGFAVRHALTREAVLASILPPDRQRLAGALAGALAARAGDGPASPETGDAAGDASADVAELFEAAGDTGGAAGQWLAAARSAIARGALLSAVDALGRGSALAEAAGEAGDGTALDIREATVEVHALAGDMPQALAAGQSLADELEARGDQDRLTGLRLRLARALLAGGQWDAAADLLDKAAGHDAVLDRVLAAQLALGRQDSERAAELAQEALEAVGEDRPEAACEAWEVLGRAARGRDVVEAEAAFEEGYRIADQHGLVLWRCRALAQLGSLELTARRPTDDRLVAARRAALEAGAIATAARVELDLNILRIRYFELAPAMEAIDSAVTMMQRLHLPDLASAHLIRALTHGLAGRDAAMAADIVAARRAPMTPVMEAVGLPGHVLAPVALARGRYDDARAHFAAAIEAARRHPGLPFSLRGHWALLETVVGVSGDGGAAAREEVRTGPQATSPHNWFALRYADAVAAGRAGDRDEAERIFADAEWAFPGREPWMELHARALVARCAASDGWGEPERWFRQALEGFVDDGLTEAASACRVAMRDAGFAVPRRGAGTSRVPAHLQALGVTAREYDVLELVADGMANKEIAERLYLSVRTVETHVARLLQRTGSAERGELAAALAGADS